jgi:acetyltransferase-like isoleucine patch superfamily enzyme
MSNTIAPTAIVHPQVQLGDNVTIEDFCVIGVPFRAYQGEQTVIGDHAVIRSHTVIYAGNRIGQRFQSGHKANLRELNTLGDDVSIGTLTVVEHHVRMGHGVRIHSQAFIPEFTILDDRCWIGPNVVLTNAKFPQHPNAKAQLQAPHIESQARIGANSTLLPGVCIGHHSLVGAGSLVTQNVPPGVIVAGSPAQYLRDVDY